MSGLDLSGEIESLFRQKIGEFLDWADAHWAVSEKDRGDEVFREMSDDRVEGYNAGIQSMRDAFKVWIEEFPI